MLPIRSVRRVHLHCPLGPIQRSKRDRPDTRGLGREDTTGHRLAARIEEAQRRKPSIEDLDPAGKLREPLAESALGDDLRKTALEVLTLLLEKLLLMRIERAVGPRALCRRARSGLGGMGGSGKPSKDRQSGGIGTEGVGHKWLRRVWGVGLVWSG